MNFSKMTIDELLLKAGLIINNSKNDQEILDLVSPFGYNAEKLSNGGVLFSSVNTLVANQKKEYGEANQAQDNYEQKKDIADKSYIIHLKVARIAFKNNVQAQFTLELNGRRASTISGWIQQTRNFYNSILANEDWKAGMASFGQTEDIMSKGLAGTEEISSLYEIVKKENGEAQNATNERDKKIEELVDWLSDYVEIAKIALENKPQLLEKLGIVVKN